MTKDQIKEIQRKVRTNPDGIWGPLSSSACIGYLKSLMPNPHPFPVPSKVPEFFGKAGDQKNFVRINVAGKGIKYDSLPVSSILVNRRCSNSLLRILNNIAIDPTCSWILDEYAGCFNNRNITGGNSPSMHAYAIAVDFAPSTNGNHTKWPNDSNMPFSAIEHFAREGWKSAGAFWNRDAMHFEATK